MAFARYDRHSIFNAAANHSDPGQYMVNIAFAQQGRTGSEMGYYEDWCADFISDCAIVAGQTAAIPASANVTGLTGNICSTAAGGREVSVAEAKAGDIALIDWPDSGSKWDHVEIVVGSNGSSVNTIGGNSGKTTATQNKYLYRQVVYHEPLRGYNEIRIFRPNYKQIIPPSNLQINSNKTQYRLGETATFSFSYENATEVFIPIDINGQRKHFIDVKDKNTFSLNLAETGDYYYCLYAKNTIGEIATDYFYFHVSDAVPDNMWIHSDKEQYNIGDNVTFSFSYSNAAEVFIPIDVNGQRKHFIDVKGKSVYSLKLTEAGDYSFCLYARNATGEIATDYYNFHVNDSVSDRMWINSDRKQYCIGDTAIFSFSCVNASELFIPIDVNGKRQYFIDVKDKNTYSLNLTEAGDYFYCIYERDAEGEIATKYSHFYVYDSVPEEGWISSDQTNVPINGKITFQYDALYATHFVLGVWDGKNLAVTDVGTDRQYTLAFNEIGTFKVHVAAYNEFGHIDTSNIIINVYNPECIHDWEWVIDKTADCASEGLKHQKCDKCGQIQNQNTIVGFTDHSWNIEEVITSTCAKEGKMFFLCTVCGKTKEEPLEKMPHADNNDDGICDECGTVLEVSQHDPNCVCGQYHTGPFAKFIIFFHRIIDLFRNQFKFV